MKNSALLTSRQTKFTAYATLYTVIVIAALGMANWLANRHNKSIDTTSNKRFSLSDQTKKVVGDLKQDVKITYFDKTSSFQPAKDLLDRYNTLSPKVSVDYIDPDKKPQLAKAAGVRNYGTIFVDVAQRHQEAKSLSEEEVTGAMIRALKGGERTVCTVSGSGEHKIDDTGRDGYSGAKDQMEKSNMKTRSISLLDKAEVPKDCTVLLVAGPRFDYIQPVVNAIKTYVEAGGHALILLDAPVKLGKEQIAENPALTGLVESWGITPNKDLVLDVTGVGQVFGFGPEVALVADYENQAVVSGMKGTATAFPMARSLEVKSGGANTVEKLFSSSERSYATSNLSSAEIRINPEKDKKGPLLLAASTSFAAKPSGQARVIVVGSSGWAANSIVGFNGNRDLFLNMLAWLSADEDLIAIRPKDPEDRRLTLGPNQMKLMFYGSVVLLPMLMLFTGLNVWWKRR